MTIPFAWYIRNLRWKKIVLWHNDRATLFAILYLCEENLPVSEGTDSNVEFWAYFVNNLLNKQLSFRWCETSQHWGLYQGYICEVIMSTPFAVLPLFATRFAACIGGIRINFIEPYHLKWYMIVCMRYLAWTFSQMKYIYMMSMLTPKTSGNGHNHGYFGGFHAVSTKENISGIWEIKLDIELQSEKNSQLLATKLFWFIHFAWFTYFENICINVCIIFHPILPMIKN